MEPNGRCGITNKILEKLNDSVSHVYIQSPPGYGKTELIDYFLKGKKYWKAGEPSAFLFGTLPDHVDFIWFEDFDLHKYSGHLNTLLSLMDHKETTLSKKCVDDRTVICPARHIYISNYHIPGDYPMFARRLQVFEIDHKLFQCGGCGVHQQQTTGVIDPPDLEQLSQDQIEELFDTF